jgi:hypothetical protein
VKRNVHEIARIIRAIRTYLPTLKPGDVISDSYARAIASLWDTESPLVRLANTGAIDEHTDAAASEALATEMLPAGREALQHLDRYIRHHDHRPPVADWAKRTS